MSAIAFAKTAFHCVTEGVCEVFTYEDSVQGTLELYGSPPLNASDSGVDDAAFGVVEHDLKHAPYPWKVALDREITSYPWGRAMAFSSPAHLEALYIFPVCVSKVTVEPSGIVAAVAEGSSQWRTASVVLTDMEDSNRSEYAVGLRAALGACGVTDAAMSAIGSGVQVVDPAPPPPPSVPVRNVIGFTGGRGVYGFMSNMYKGKPYKVRTTLMHSAENHYQFEKAVRFGYLQEAEAILAARDPYDAKILGRPPNLNLMPTECADWESQEQYVMKKVLRAKFLDQSMRAALMATAPADLEEQTYDPKWGTGVKGGSGPGQNLLGKALMAIRAEYIARA